MNPNTKLNGIEVTISDNHGGLYAGGKSGLIHYCADGTQESHLTDYDINDLQIDDTGRVWVCTNAGVFHRNDGEEKWGHLDFHKGQITAIDYDPNNSRNLFIGTGDKGIAYFRGGYFKKMITQVNSELTSDCIYSLITDNVDNIWVGVTVQHAGVVCQEIIKLDMTDLTG